MTTDPIWSAIILAAGQSSRFGGGKLRAVYQEKPVLDWVLDAALACPVAEIVVVCGGDPVIADSLPMDGLIRGVWAKDHALGMGVSLSEGLGALDPKSQGVLVFLGDMPRVPAHLVRDLIAAIGQGALAAAPEFAGRRGHPVLISSALFDQIAALRGDQGAGQILDQLGEKLVLIKAPDDGCLFDIDRPGDLLA
jgi:molybdenum cofactor cytidylyltransferase